MVSVVRKLFGSLFPGSYVSVENKVGAAKRVTNSIVTYLLRLSKFDSMLEEEIYEQLYVWEPEVGSAIDKIASLAAQSFCGPYLNVSNNEVVTDKDRKMLKKAVELTESMELCEYFEALVEVLMTQGNVFLDVRTPGEFTFLPNRYCTLLPDKTMISTGAISDPDKMPVITTATILVMNEGLNYEQIYNKGEYKHIRYKKTPVFSKDIRGRPTYGIYSVSPLHRTILPVWWMRQTMMIDILWRFKNVPREHHKIDSTLFSMDKYDGTLAERRTAARADAQTFVEDYCKMLEDQMPDQAYVTLDTTSVEEVQKYGISDYMRTNELFKQGEERIWTSMNVPSSIVNGRSAGSYASELIVSNYVSSKVIMIGMKVKPTILDILRYRLSQLDSSWDVSKIDIKLDLMLSASEIEKFRQASMMVASGCFTRDEIRDYLGYEELTEEQLEELIQSGRVQTVGDIQRDVGSMGNEPQYPDTPQSSEQHKQDASDLTIRAAQT